MQWALVIGLGLGTGPEEEEQKHDNTTVTQVLDKPLRGLDSKLDSSIIGLMFLTRH